MKPSPLKVVRTEMFALLLTLSVAGAESPDFAKNVELINRSDSIVFGLKNLDLILRKTPDLRVTLDVLGKDSVIDSYRVDFAHESTPSHIVIEKSGKNYVQVIATFMSHGKTLTSVKRELPPVVTAIAGPPLLDQQSDIIARIGAPEDIPRLSLLDESRIRVATLGKPGMTVDIEALKRRISADFNFPTAFKVCPITNQTAHPQDDSRKSLYISANNDLYDTESGEYDSTLKYLIEIPVNPEWTEKSGDRTVVVSPDDIRIHMTTDEVEVRRLGTQRITGNRKGGLTQTTNSCCVGDDGNIYFSMQYRSPIRFNISKAAFEAPPVNVFDFHLQHKPERKDLPYPEDVVHEELRTDFNNVIFAFRNRVWVMPQRYGVFGDKLLMACIVSIPTDHWDDPDAFRSAMLMNARAVPGSPLSLWSTHVSENDHQRKLLTLVPLGKRVFIQSYHANYGWVMELNEDNSTKSLIPLETLDGKRITSFGRSTRVLYDGEKLLGMTIDVGLEGTEKTVSAFLPVDTGALTSSIPKSSRSQYGNSFYAAGWLYTGTSYGSCRFENYNVNHFLKRPHTQGVLTIQYDAIEAMRRHPGKNADVIRRMAAASMGPEYFAFPIPGEGASLLGVADYPMYNLARYDISKDGVNKSFLLRPSEGQKLNLPAAMGPYCYHWFREGSDDVLYYAGYTGIGRLVYRRNGSIPERHSVTSLGNMSHISLDGTPFAYIKWFRDLAPGLGDKVFLTGINQVSRGGTAYSNGLMYFHRNSPKRLHKLSRMTACYNTTSMATRLRGRPGGEVVQDIFLNGNGNQSAVESLPEAERPKNVQPRVFVYQDRGASGVHDLFGFTVSDSTAEAAQVDATAVSQNGLYLVVLMNGGTLATLDLQTWKWSDAVKLDMPLVSFTFNRRGQELLTTPNGELLLSHFEQKEPAPETTSGSAVFQFVDVASDGSIRIRPHIRCTFSDRLHFASPICFVPGEGDAYDLVFGPHSRKPQGCVRVIANFLTRR